MWKDFFYFNKAERRAIIALAILVVIIQSFIWTSDLWLPLLPGSKIAESNIQKEMNAFRDSLSGTSHSPQPSYSSRFSESVDKVRLSAFNPNVIDSAGIISLGLSPYIARNILKYRRMGGVFRKTEDFARIYGLEPEQYARLKPYIQIQPQRNDFQGERFTPIPEKTENGVSRLAGHEAVPIATSVQQRMDVNTVDTAVLQQIKGVGSITANRIARYRSRLGGFYSVRQLEEIRGIYPDALARLQTFLKVDTLQIVKLNVNRVSLDKLRAHPYLSFYQAKVIVELRRARSGIRNIRELSEFKEFTTDDIERLKWYLAF